MRMNDWAIAQVYSSGVRRGKVGMWELTAEL